MLSGRAVCSCIVSFPKTKRQINTKHRKLIIDPGTEETDSEKTPPPLPSPLEIFVNKDCLPRQHTAQDRFRCAGTLGTKS